MWEEQSDIKQGEDEHEQEWKCEEPHPRRDVETQKIRLSETFERWTEGKMCQEEVKMRT